MEEAACKHHTMESPCANISMEESPEPSYMSIKTDALMDCPPQISSVDFPDDLSREESPEISHVSMKTDASMDPPIEFRCGDVSADLSREESPVISHVSIKTDASMDPPIEFHSRDVSTDLSNEQDGSMSPSGKKQLDSIFEELQNKAVSLLKEELVRLKALLISNDPVSSKNDEEYQVKEGILKIILHVLWKMNQTDLVKTLQEKLAPLFLKKHKSALKDKFQRINEGTSMKGNSFLNEIYTELYITEGGSGEVNSEHEVRQIERKSVMPETPIKCSDIFKTLPSQDKPPRTVLTKGVAGIGKTVSVQKFILDWAEGTACQNVHFIFPFPFRELNLIKAKNMSLMGLLHRFFTDTEELRAKDLNAYKILFIFDGLDECRLPLDFLNNQRLRDETESASVDVLLTNLIMRNLLPSSLIWITTRPVAASQIPSEFVDRITEVRGFNDPQKDEYFRKKIPDENLSCKIIAHIKSSRSLHIMCHIPVFCWIAATVLVGILSESVSGDIPKTLTQMFTHFLILQIKLKTEKFEGKSDVDLKQTRKTILLLGKLAFEQLEKGNLIFYEEDLREIGIDVREASVFSGVCTQIFREEFGLHLGRVFSFVHLSVQEFLAAVYVYVSFASKKKNSSKSKLPQFLKGEVDRALLSVNGHLDLFLRFLLGLSLESNQTVLRSLLKLGRKSSHVKPEIVNYIKMKVRDNPSPEKSLNLFYCLNELNDHSLENEVQTYLNSNKQLSELSSSQWSALVFMLLTSELNEFKLRKYYASEECLLRLLPVVTASRIANLSDCCLEEKSCSALAKALSSPSSLKILNMSNNDLEDSGMKLLSAGLENSNCHLETLMLSNCCIREEGCADLASALRSNPSHIRELDLSFNKPGDSGVKQLSLLLEDPQCKLEKLQLSYCCIGEESCVFLVLALKSNSSHLRELNLSFNKPGNSGVSLLSSVLMDPQCPLEKLQLSACNVTDESCAAIALSLKSNSSHLRELNLNYNKVGDLGAQKLSAGLMDQHCKLEILGLSWCKIGEEGCAALASALISNPLHLREIDLSNNELGHSETKMLTKLQNDPQCKLQKLQLHDYNTKDCSALALALKADISNLKELKLTKTNLEKTEVELFSAILADQNCKLESLQFSNCTTKAEGCAALISALMSNPSHLRELNLNKIFLSDSGVKLLSYLLKDHCKLESLQLSHCNINWRGCFALTSALRSNLSHLKQLSLMGNILGDSEWNLLFTLLKNQRCKLEKLELRNCYIRVECCAALVSALKFNPSHLRELDLSYNYPGDSVIKQLGGVLANPACKIEKLQLEFCQFKQSGCAALASALKSNPSHLRELNLNRNPLGDIGVQHLSAALKDPQCKLEKLQLSNCRIGNEGCAHLASALRSNPSHLRELGLNNNDCGDLGIKQLSDLRNDPQCKLEELHVCPVL